LPLCGYGIGDAIEVLVKHEHHRSAPGGVTIEGAGIKLCDALFDRRLRRAYIVRAVAAAEMYRKALMRLQKVATRPMRPSTGSG